MKSLRLMIFCLLITCTTINIEVPKWEGEIYNPIVDSGKRVHDYKMSKLNSFKFELNNNYSLYCIRHNTWEIVRVKYYKNTDSIQYIVNDAWPK